MAASGVRVRPASRADMPAVHRMIHELAAFEGMPDGPQLSVSDLIEDGFECDPPWFFALVAETVEGAGEGAAAGGDGRLVGYALCNRAYSSWTRRAMYLEDLYVAPRARRAGVATALLAALAQMAVSEGVQRIDWHVLEGNAPAQALYARLGARDLRRSEGRAALRLDAPHIRRLAAAAAAAPPAAAPTAGPAPAPADTASCSGNI